MLVNLMTSSDLGRFNRLEVMMWFLLSMISVAFSAPIHRAETPSDLLNKVLPSHLSEVEVGKTSRDQIIKWFGKPGEEISDELAYNISGVEFDLTFKFKGKVVSGYYYEPTSEASLRDLTIDHLQKATAKEIEMVKISSNFFPCSHPTNEIIPMITKEA